MPKYKVVLHVNENERFKHSVDNMENLIKSGKDLEISLVLTGEPVKLATYDKRIKGLVDKDVQVSVCQIASNHFKVAEKDLIKGVEIVEGGALELIIKQDEGFAYIKP